MESSTQTYGAASAAKGNTRKVAPRSVPFFNYSALFTRQEEELVSIFRDVGRRGAFIMQQDLRDFERNLARFLSVKYAFGAADGTEAIVIALKASGVKPGDEVILPSHTYIATAAAVQLIGAVPVLADCGPDHMLSPESVRKVITSKTRAIMPVQLNGRTCDMDALQLIAEQHGLLIVEDAAQGLGSKFKGRYAGTFGSAGTFSFYPAKVLGCFGDGGAIVTNDDKVAEQIAILRDHGRNVDGTVVTWGYNCRLDNLQAAFLDFKLKTYPQEIARRREIASIYQSMLGSLAEVQLPPAPDADARHFDVYQNYEIEAERRDELKAYLETKSVRALVQWAGKAVHQFEALGFKAKPEYTERMFKRCLMIPMNTTLSNEDVQYVAQTILEFYGK
jgi:dTDP-4-amino-4,6-dideoxygalactose transaminase